MDKDISRSKEKLISFVSKEITNLFGGMLNFTEVAVGDKGRYSALRSKILKISNDTIRNISREVVDRYDINYNPPVKEIVVVRNAQKKNVW